MELHSTAMLPETTPARGGQGGVKKAGRLEDPVFRREALFPLLSYLVPVITFLYCVTIKPFVRMKNTTIHISLPCGKTLSLLL